VAFEEREANELAYARLVAERFRTTHHEVTLTQSEFFASLPKLVWHEDEPLAHPSSVALNAVSALAARHVKVVLTGEGSDETLAGYNRYRVTLANVKLAALWRRVPAFARRFVRGAIDSAPGGGTFPARLRRTFLYLPGNLDSLYLDNFAVFGRLPGQALLSRTLRDELSDIDPYAAFREAASERAPASLLTQLLYADSRTYLQELLMKQDQMSMAASIESRVPFLDHPLAEFATRLPDRLKLRGTTTKVVLRQAMQGMLPEAILTRSKMGFPVPIGRWLRGDSRSLLDEFVTSPRALDRGLFAPEAIQAIVSGHVSGAARHDERLWALITFEIWQRIFFDGETPDQVMPGNALARWAA
jgi:asparagine synthase (glutamine-hydrolysing)